MDFCRLVDYSDRPDGLVELHNFDCVTRETLREARSIIVSGHFGPVEVGDRIEAFIVDNRTDGVQAVLTVWHTKGVACLDKGEGRIWGDWQRDARLVLTYEFQEVKDVRGTPGIARIAYNVHGMRGTWEGGKFYTLFLDDGSTKDQETGRRRQWNVPNARRRSEL